MSMIKNLWKSTKFYCCYRHAPTIMEINNRGEFSPFYSCPKYYSENREEGEPACPNRLNFVDAEAILDNLSTTVLQDISGGVVADYTGYKFKHKAIDVRVKKYSPGNVELEVLNRKALK